MIRVLIDQCPKTLAAARFAKKCAAPNQYTGYPPEAKNSNQSPFAPSVRFTCRSANAAAKYPISRIAPPSRPMLKFDRPLRSQVESNYNSQNLL